MTLDLPRNKESLKIISNAVKGMKLTTANGTQEIYEDQYYILVVDWNDYTIKQIERVA